MKRAGWRVPVLVDGRRKALAGEIWRVPAPPLWPWLSLGAPFAISVLLILLGRRHDRLRAGASGFGALAAAGAIATAVTFAVSGSATEGRWLEGANEIVFALVGVAFLVRGSANARAFAAGGLGLLALAAASTKIPALLHGVVLSALPATPTRLAVAVALWAGAAATIVGLVIFFEVLDEPQLSPRDEPPRAWEGVAGVGKPALRDRPRP